MMYTQKLMSVCQCTRQNQTKLMKKNLNANKSEKIQTADSDGSLAG